MKIIFYFSIIEVFKKSFKFQNILVSFIFKHKRDNNTHSNTFHLFDTTYVTNNCKIDRNFNTYCEFLHVYKIVKMVAMVMWPTYHIQHYENIGKANQLNVLYVWWLQSYVIFTGLYSFSYVFYQTLSSGSYIIH